MCESDETTPPTRHERLREAAALIREVFEYRSGYHDRWWPIAETLDELAAEIEGIAHQTESATNISYGPIAWCNHCQMKAGGAIKHKDSCLSKNR